jgi:hypothetical protein
MKLITVVILLIVWETINKTKITYFSQNLSIDTVIFYSKLKVYLLGNNGEFDVFG